MIEQIDILYILSMRLLSLIIYLIFVIYFVIFIYLLINLIFIFSMDFFYIYSTLYLRYTSGHLFIFYIVIFSKLSGVKVNIELTIHICTFELIKIRLT